MTVRTSTGARLVPQPPTAIEDRMARLDAAKAAYEEEAEEAWGDYRARSAEVWMAWRQRLDGITAAYHERTEAIRAGRA